MKLRVKKHNFVAVPSANNVINQGVQCMDLADATGLDGSFAQEESAAAPYVNVTQMYRRKWPNASNIRWWVQSRVVTTGSEIKVGDQCDGDMTKDTCKREDPDAPTIETFCKFEYATASFPSKFYRAGQLIGFKEPYKCPAKQPSHTANCATGDCTKFWGEMTTFFGTIAPTNAGYSDGDIKSPASVFGQYKIATNGGDSTTSWFTVETGTLRGQPGWTDNQVCPSKGTTIIHVPTYIEGDWYPSSTCFCFSCSPLLLSSFLSTSLSRSRPTPNSRTDRLPQL
jgi:hypothetical protein